MRQTFKGQVWVESDYGGTYYSGEYVDWLENYIEELESQNSEYPANESGVLIRNIGKDYAKYYFKVCYNNNQVIDYTVKAETIQVEIVDPYVSVINNEINYNTIGKIRLTGVKGLIYCDMDGEHVLRMDDMYKGISLKKDYKVVVPQIQVKIIDPNLSLYKTEKECYLDYSSKYLK